MKYLQNLHTHCTYCDGKDTPREMIETAIEKGFNSVGFSSHSYMNWSNVGAFKIEREQDYKNEILALKEEYKGKLDVFLGLEVDMYSKMDYSDYEYLIGSVHYLKIDGKMVGIDRLGDEILNAANLYFGGDTLSLAEEYYSQIKNLPDSARFDILGHFDIIAKHYKSGAVIDRDNKRYRNAAIEALEALAGKIPYFEVNTGGMVRGYHNIPYPYEPFLKEFKRLGFGAVISSDCHDRNYIDFYFDESKDLLKRNGFKEIYVLKNGGFEAIEI